MAKLFGFEKVCDIFGRRIAHEIFHRVGLLEAAGVHDRDAVRERNAVGQVMGDIESRQAIFFVK